MLIEKIVIKRKTETVFLGLLILNIPLLYSTWGHVWYSDDYQSILAFGFKQLLSDNLDVYLGDLFEMRTDGHLHPVFYALSYLFSLADSANTVHVIKIALHVIASYLVYLVSCGLGFNYATSSLASFFYTINYSVHIKILSWNVWGSLVVNMITGLIMLLFAIKYYKENNPRLLGGVFLFSLLTIFNMENGFAFPVIISALSIIYFHNKKININQLMSIIVVSVAPIMVYSSIAFYQTSSFMPLLDKRVDSSFSEAVAVEERSSNVDNISYLRSRKAPRTFEAYSIRATDLLLSSLNISSIEYTAKSILNDLQSKSEYDSLKQYIYSFINQNTLLLFILFSLTVLIAAYSFVRNRSIMMIGLPSRVVWIIYVILLLMFVFVFHRKDISSLIAFPASVIIASVMYNLFKRNNAKIAIMLTTFYIAPSIIYYEVGFDNVYEMIPAVEQKKYYRIFDREIYNYDLRNGKLIYIGDEDENAIIKRYKADFYWHLVWHRRNEFLDNEFFLAYKDQTFLTMLNGVEVAGSK